MNDKKFYLRFGLHRDRDMLRFLKDDYAGIVLPAHILAYSPNATIAALRFIDKPYFVDPMTYIYAKGFLEGYKVRKKEDQRDHLKPSINKLTHDLSLSDIFPEIDTVPLEADDFNDELITRLARGNLNLQLNKVNNELQSSTPKLDKLLADIGLPPSQTVSTFQPPIFITAPYFLIPQENAQKWIEINTKLASETKRLAPEGTEIRPIILTYTSQLKTGLIEQYVGFKNFIIWVEDLDESKTNAGKDHISKLIALRDFVYNCNLKGVKILNLYGSFFSATLLKYGLSAFCNGPLYGEYKSSAASLGGIPPVRVYIPTLHRFYIFSQAMELLKLHPDLFSKFPANSKRLFGSIGELAKILENVTLAQEHFINCRNQEIAYIEEQDMDQIIQDLALTHKSIGLFDSKPLKGKEPNQLHYWAKALSQKVQ